MQDDQKAKVFCIGFQKTGTSSLNQALTQLGYSVVSYYGDGLSYAQLRESYVRLGLELAAQHDAVEDMPFPLIFRELDEAFPGAKFILTQRETERWFASVLKHFGKKPNARRKLIYGEDAPFPDGNKERYCAVYEAHNSDVREYFSDRSEDLLVLNLEEGHGWKELGDFLGRSDVPDGAFVHANKANKRDTIGYRTKIFKNRIKGRLGLG